MIAQKIIDMHFHIWDTEVLSIPWLELFNGKLKQQYTIEDKHAINGHNIIQSFYEEVDAIKEQHKQEAEMIIGLCKDNANHIVGATIAADLVSKIILKSLQKSRQ